MSVFRNLIMTMDDGGGGLPDTYQEVEYLESTGTQYIDTGYAPYKTKTEVKFQEPNGLYINSIAYIVACFNYNDNRYYTVHYNQYDADYNHRYFASSQKDNTAIELNDWDNSSHIIIYNDENNKVKFDGVIKGTVSDLTEQGTKSIYLFANHTGNDQAAFLFTGRIYYAKITDKDTGNLVRDYVPCYRKSDNKPGMYDLVNGVFYTNQGTGEFEIPLPSEYQEAEYIESTYTQYIDTGVVPDIDTKMEVNFAITDRTTHNTMGSALSGNLGTFQIGGMANLSAYFSVETSTGVVVSPGDTNYHTYYISNGLQKIDNTTANNTITAFGDTMLSIYLFGRHIGWEADNKYCNGKLKYAKIWQGDTLIRDYIPCYRKSDNKPGLYDLVNNVFYTNQGTGEFIFPLPNEYQEVEYIEGTGTQYIDTGFKPNNNTRLTIDYDVISTVNWKYPLGTCGGTSGSGKSFFIEVNDQIKNNYSMGASGYANGKTATGRHLIDWNKNIVTDNNTSYTMQNVGSFQSNYNIHIFGFTNYSNEHAGSPNDMKVYSCTIYDNDTLIRDYIPCYRKSDGEIGLYDLINNTFNVNQGTGTFITPGVLPNTYQKVNYIEGTGTQYINTGFKPNQNTRMVADFQYTNNNQGYRFAGSQDYEYDTSSFRFGSSNAGIYIVTYGNETARVGSPDTNRHIFDFNKNVTYVDSQMLYTFTNQTFTSSYNAYIFSINSSNPTDLSPAKLYSFKIYDNSVLVRDYVPCYRKSDNVIGLYDLVNNVFYTNQGTGTFIKGSYILNGYHILDAFPNENEPRHIEQHDNNRMLYIPCLPNTTYTVSKIKSSRFHIWSSDEEPYMNMPITSSVTSHIYNDSSYDGTTIDSLSYTTNSTASYLCVRYAKLNSDYDLTPEQILQSITITKN